MHTFRISTLKTLIREEYQKILLEGKAENIIEKHPDLKPAYDAGIRNPQYLNWLRKRVGEEPLEDVIDVVISFDEKKHRIKQSKYSADIYSYSSPDELRSMLEELGASKSSKKKAKKEKLWSNEIDHIGSFGEWDVYMPYTKDSSCFLGKGTTWCTAATQSRNLFTSYVTSGGDDMDDRDIILYYAIRQGADPRKDPTAKVSLGLLNGVLQLRGRDGGLSVDAKNKGINTARFREIFGSQAQKIKSAIESHADKLSGRHPAKSKMNDIMQIEDLQKAEKALTKLDVMSFHENDLRKLANSALERSYVTDAFKEALANIALKTIDSDSQVGASLIPFASMLDFDKFEHLALPIAKKMTATKFPHNLADAFFQNDTTPASVYKYIFEYFNSNEQLKQTTGRTISFGISQAKGEVLESVVLPYVLRTDNTSQFASITENENLSKNARKKVLARIEDLVSKGAIAHGNVYLDVAMGFLDVLPTPDSVKEDPAIKLSDEVVYSSLVKGFVGTSYKGLARLEFLGEIGKTSGSAVISLDDFNRKLQNGLLYDVVETIDRDELVDKALKSVGRIAKMSVEDAYEEVIRLKKIESSLFTRTSSNDTKIDNISDLTRAINQSISAYKAYVKIFKTVKYVADSYNVYVGEIASVA